MRRRKQFQPSRCREYILVDGKAVAEPDLIKWIQWQANTVRILRQDFLLYHAGVLTPITGELYGSTLERRAMPGIPLSKAAIQANTRAKAAKRDLDGIPLQLSTIFLGINQSWRDEGPPILWETMLFGIDRSVLAQYQYSSGKKALHGHTSLLNALFTLAASGDFPTCFTVDNQDLDDDDEIELTKMNSRPPKGAPS